MDFGIIIGIILIIILFLFSYSACVISSRYSRLEEENMSILQEYEEHREIIGEGRIKAIEQYIEYSTKNGRPLLYSDIVYKEKEYELFDNWFQNEIKPFKVFDNNDSTYSVILDQSNYFYDWLEEKKKDKVIYGDGHCYEDAFKQYLESELNSLAERINYDSENGMFCANCDDIKDAEELAYELSIVYKNEDNMLDLIKRTKEINGYEFERNINI